MIYPVVYNFTIEQRATFARQFALSDDEGASLDMTGYTCTASLWTPRRKKLLDFTRVWDDQEIGEFTIALTPTQTTGLSGVAVWDLLVENPDGTLDYYLRGEVLIEEGFTVA